MSKTGSLEITPLGECELVMTRSFAAPRRMVFDAHTRPELLRRWLLGPDGWTMTVCEVDLRVGGAFRYMWKHHDGREMGMGGVYREVVVPERLVNTELFDEDWTGGETVCTAVFSEAGGRTTVTTTVRYATRAARDGAAQGGMAGGMEAGYRRLDEMFAAAAA